MERIKDEREVEKPSSQTALWGAAQSYAGIVPSFNTPAQRERKEPHKKMLFRKREKGKREEREEETDLIFAPLDQRQWVATESCLLWKGPCLRGGHGFTGSLILFKQDYSQNTCQTHEKLYITATQPFPDRMLELVEFLESRWEIQLLCQTFSFCVSPLVHLLRFLWRRFLGVRHVTSLLERRYNERLMGS